MRTILKRSHRPEPNAEPNVIPFIDIMLVLLVIFMVTAPAPETDFKVNLPLGPVVASATADQPTAVRISQTAAGVPALTIEGEPVSAAAFRARLLEVARARNPGAASLAALFTDANIVVSADQSVRYDAVYGVVDEIGAAGFRKVNLMVEEAA